VQAINSHSDLLKKNVDNVYLIKDKGYTNRNHIII